MKSVAPERLSWFWVRRLRIEHDLLITRGKFYGIGWATTGWRSQYRIVGSAPVPPWQARRERT